MLPVQTHKIEKRWWSDTYDPSRFEVTTAALSLFRVGARYSAEMLRWLKGNGRWLAPTVLVLINLVLITLLLLQHPTIVAVPAGAAPAEPVASAGPSDSGTGPDESLSPSGAVRTSESIRHGGSTTLSESASNRVDPSPTRSASPSPSVSPSSAAGPARLLAANSAKIAWRAEQGTCGRRSTVEVTDDGGRTWRKTRPGIRGIVRLRAYGENSVFAVGADAQCKPTYAWIGSPDGTWHRDQSVIWDVWFRFPDHPDRVHAPGGRTSRPCADHLVSFAATDDSAAALCGDGRIRTMQKEQAWRTVARQSSAVALGNSEQGIVIAQPSASCTDLVVRRLSLTGTGLAAGGPGCRPGAEERLSVAIGGSTVWQWVGNDVVVS